MLRLLPTICSWSYALLILNCGYSADSSGSHPSVISVFIVFPYKLSSDHTVTHSSPLHDSIFMDRGIQSVFDVCQVLMQINGIELLFDTIPTYNL